MALKILLVDDDSDMHTIFQIVAEHHGASLSIVRDAESAFNYLERDLPDVIVVDLFMFEPDGYQILHQIRHNEAWASCPVVATTAFYSTPTAAKVLFSGFDGYLPKPFAIMELMPYLEKIASSGHPAACKA